MITIGLRNIVHELLPLFRINSVHARTDEPVEITLSGQKRRSQHQPGDLGRMALSVQERQGRTPGPTEEQPAIDAKFATDIVQVTNQIGRSIADDLSMGNRTPRASLIDENDPVRFGIEKGTVIRLATGTRP